MIVAGRYIKKRSSDRDSGHVLVSYLDFLVSAETLVSEEYFFGFQRRPFGFQIILGFRIRFFWFPNNPWFPKNTFWFLNNFLTG